MKNPYIGSLAEQLMNGVRRIVIFLSRSDGSVLLAITPGTVHPNPTSIGTMLLPDSPILRRSLSITNATLAIYPLSSSSDRKKNKVTMIGRKLSTLPTPLKIPSITSECITSLTSSAVIPLSTISVSAPIPVSSHPDRNEPITLKVSQKTTAIIQINAGIAVYLPVSILSILRLLICSRLSLGLTTAALQTRSMNPNLISAIAAARSRFLSSSICRIICSTVSFSFWLRFRLSIISSSPSASLHAANLRGMPAFAA